MENLPSIDILIAALSEYQEQLETTRIMLGEVLDENGMEDNPVFPDAKYRKTITHLRNQIERMDKWLAQRKEEVTTLQQSIVYERERKAHYKKLVDDLSRRHVAKDKDYEDLADEVRDYADGKKSWAHVLRALDKVRRRDFEIDTEDGGPYEIPGS